MIALAASVLPRVEDPFPETIGLGTVFAAAGAGGVVGSLIGSFEQFRTRERTRDWWTGAGLQWGFMGGGLFYLAAVIGQLIS